MYPILEHARPGVMAAALIVMFGAATPAVAENPCKSEDPLDFDDAVRRADCGDSDREGWGTYDYDRSMDRIPDEGTAAVNPYASTEYAHLPTTFTAWFNSLTPAERRQIGTRLADEAGAGNRDFSARELDAFVTLAFGELDSYLASEELSATERRKAIAEVAMEVGLSIEPKSDPGLGYETFGRSDYDNRYEGWDRVDPTDPTGDFGRPDGDTPESDLDLLDDF